MRWFQWIDRNLWSVPVIVFLSVWAATVLWSAASSKPVLLAAAAVASRQAVYSSLTGSAGAFFAAALAVVAILVVFPRLSETSAEQALARARARVVSVLLAASGFLVTVVVVATTAMAIDAKPIGNTVITSLIEASAAASVIGLLVGGFGLALVIVERSRK